MGIEQTVELLSGLSQDEANTFALVLTAHGLPYAVRRGADGWQIRVPEGFHEEAARLVEAYLAENPDDADADASASIPAAVPKSFSGVWVSLALLAVHLARMAGGGADSIVGKAAASAGAIVSGEIYRAATALLLHADVLHLAGNIVGIAVFATAVCNLTGSGLGWSMILASGILGNLVNAWLVRSAHTSIGASTAVFGAVGILAAVQFYKKHRAGASRFRAGLPLAGGLALLAFLGAGEHTDITAHLFGFCSGALLGLLYSLRVRRPPPHKVQRRWLAAAAAIMALSWLPVL